MSVGAVGAAGKLPNDRPVGLGGVASRLEEEGLLGLGFVNLLLSWGQEAKAVSVNVTRCVTPGTIITCPGRRDTGHNVSNRSGGPWDSSTRLYVRLATGHSAPRQLLENLT